MMIDFEDKMPGPPLSVAEWIMLVTFFPISVYCFVMPFVTLGRWVWSLIAG